jgi:hypothetical protein
MLHYAASCKLYGIIAFACKLYGIIVFACKLYGISVFECKLCGLLRMAPPCLPFCSSTTH